MEIETIYQKREKLKNKYNLFKFISKVETFTKLDVSTALKLSIPTVSKIVDDFLNENLINDIGVSQGGLGRKSTIYRYNPSAFYSLGILIESNSIKFLIANLQGQKIRKKTLTNIPISENSIDKIVSEIKNFINDFELNYLIKGIGLSISAFNMKNNDSKLFLENLSKKITETTSIEVSVERMASAGAILEYSQSNNKNLAFLNIGDNLNDVEIGLIIDGKTLNGGKSAQKFSPDISNETLTKNFKNLSSEPINNFHEIFTKNMFEKEDGKKILETYVFAISSFLKNVQLITDIDKIVIGGRIAEHANILEELFPEENVKFSQYNEDSSLIGTALLPLKEYFL
ncbi:ROK family protein [Cetobacterium sp. 2A]|uniref:ROK family protein n=1 Tax=unclassified Cetobacterium TaxID=2630983 RepID=UPI00163B67C2|nr:ROK family protein [Cetobacterium sp. 2A]MBC2854998.1 ROK family protein [Cetobacterium sp. 2A]